MAKLQTFSTFPAKLKIDDIELDVRVKRMTNTEYDAYAEGFDRYQTSPRGPEETKDERHARTEAASAWIKENLDAYLAIVPGELVHEGREITKGGDLLEIFGGRQDDVVVQALLVVLFENRLTAKKKATYPSLLDSLYGSTSELPPPDGGSAAVSTAGPVDANGSTSDAGATAPPSDALSGTTDPTLVEAARASV